MIVPNKCTSEADSALPSRKMKVRIGLNNSTIKKKLKNLTWFLVDSIKAESMTKFNSLL